MASKISKMNAMLKDLMGISYKNDVEDMEFLTVLLEKCLSLKEEIKHMKSLVCVKPQVDDKKLLSEGIDKKLADTILQNVVTKKSDLSFKDYIGNKEAIEMIRQSVILPRLHPDVFVGLRQPSRGMLMYGPPGTGKTFLAKCTASEANCNFFSLSASALTSKWVGEGEKMVKTLFQLAAVIAPSIIFIDEIDSLLTARVEGEQESTRRMKTEFLVQMDGISSQSTSIFFMASTNVPWEIDQAVLRRFPIKTYIGLPNQSQRIKILKNLLKPPNLHNITNEQFKTLAKNTKLYSPDDLKNIAQNAAKQIFNNKNIKHYKNIPIQIHHFNKAIQIIKPSCLCWGKGVSPISPFHDAVINFEKGLD